MVRDVVEAAIEKVILGGRGGRERDGVEGREKKEKVRGRRDSQERVFLYCKSPYSSLSALLHYPTSFPFLERLQSEMAQVSATKPDDQVPSQSLTR